MLGLAGATFAVHDVNAQAASQKGRPNYQTVNKRQSNQQQRIVNGMANGSLNKKEATRLENQQTRIDRMEDRFRTSGTGLNRRERIVLDRAQDRASRNIRRQKHDRGGTRRL